MNTITRILRSEGLVFFVAAVWAYATVGASWVMFALLLLVPDVFMAGYARDSRVGALVYNIGHTYVVPFVLLCAFLALREPILLPVAIIWTAHIAMDRMLGFGLKLDTGFKDTHLGRIGKQSH